MTLSTKFAAVGNKLAPVPVVDVDASRFTTESAFLGINTFAAPKAVAQINTASDEHINALNLSISYILFPCDYITKKANNQI